VGEGAPSFLSPADQEVKAADMPEGPAASHRPQSSGLETFCWLAFLPQQEALLDQSQLMAPPFVPCLHSTLKVSDT
jgi:hypothetical protein